MRPSAQDASKAFSFGSPRFQAALRLATRLHANQPRKSTNTPYIGHLLTVCGIVLENGGTEDESIAALLHDAIEDQGGAATRVLIQRRFGKHVASIIDECSDSDTDPKPPWRQRKEAYIAHLATAASRSALLVSICDKLTNARSILADHRSAGDQVWRRFSAPNGKQDVLWYYRALVNAYARRKDLVPPAVLSELNRVVTRIARRAAVPRP